MSTKQPLPNATAVLVLGICSIVFSCLFLGVILGIIGLSMAGKGRRMYKENPGMYDGFGSLNAGYIMSIIGTILGALYILYYIVVVLIFASAAASVWSM